MDDEIIQNLKKAIIPNAVAGKATKILKEEKRQIKVGDIYVSKKDNKWSEVGYITILDTDEKNSLALIRRSDKVEPNIAELRKEPRILEYSTIEYLYEFYKNPSDKTVKDVNDYRLERDIRDFSGR